MAIVDLMNAESRKIHAKVEIYYGAVIHTQSDATAIANQVAQYSYEAQSVDGDTTSDSKWFALNNNTLDGSYVLLPTTESDQVGVWGTTASDGSGNLSTPFVLTAEFSARTFDILRVVGDIHLDEYPVDFTIKLYGTGDSLLRTINVTGNTDVDWSSQITSTADVVKMELTVDKINKSQAVAKIVELVTSNSSAYYDDYILSMEILEELDYYSSGLPIGLVSSNNVVIKLNNANRDFDLGNPDSEIAPFLKKNKRVIVWIGIEDEFGTTQWTQIGKYWSFSWDSSDNEMYAELEARDILERLRNSEFRTSPVFESQTLYYLFDFILDDWGLGTEEYYIDPALNSITIPYVWFTPTDHRNALVQLAQMSNVNVYTDRDDVIRVEKVEPSSSVILDMAEDTNYFIKEFPLAWADIANSVDVQVYRYQKDALADVVDDDTLLTVPANDTETYTFYFDQTPVANVQAPSIIAEPGVTVDSYNAYCWGIDITFANSTGSDATISSVTVQGQPLKTLSSRTVNKRDSDSIDENGVIRGSINSPFIQDQSYAETLAQELIDQLKNARDDVNFFARGNVALVLGSKITLDGGSTNYMVVRQKFFYDGGLDSDVETRKV